MLFLCSNVKLLGTSWVLTFSVSSHRYLWINWKLIVWSRRSLISIFISVRSPRRPLCDCKGRTSRFIAASEIFYWQARSSCPLLPGRQRLYRYLRLPWKLCLNTCLCVVLNTNAGQIPFSSMLLTVWPTLSHMEVSPIFSFIAMHVKAAGFSFSLRRSNHAAFGPFYLWIMTVTVTTDTAQHYGLLSEEIFYLGMIWFLPGSWWSPLIFGNDDWNQICGRWEILCV